jgi:hypothetical protein
MAISRQPFLFSWREVEAQSDLCRLLLVMGSLPDGAIVAALQRRRGKGRNDYPVVAMWNALLAGIVFQHPSMASLLRELRRNAELRELCGFDPVLGADAVPDDHNMSRFLGNVIELEPLIQAMFDTLVEKMVAVVPDFGRHLSFDGKAVPSYSTGQENKQTGKTSDPDADYGRKTYRGVSKDGKPWATVKKWFGYQLHLIVDSDYEIPVAYEVMTASASEVTRIVPMVEAVANRHPTVVKRARELAADRGLDSGEVNRALLQERGIRPIIDTRALWNQEKQEPGRDPEQAITRPLYPQRVDVVVYTERGDVRCVCPATGEERAMAFMGYEADRDSIKYRCPAAAYGFACGGKGECSRMAPGTAGAFGRVVRIALDQDRRIFLPTPRSSPSFQRSYAKRTSVERVNARIDNVLGFEKHTIRGLHKMRTRMGLALVVMLAMAVGRILAGQAERMRSLVRPVGPERLQAA